MDIMVVSSIDVLLMRVEIIVDYQLPGLTMNKVPSGEAKNYGKRS